MFLLETVPMLPLRWIPVELMPEANDESGLLLTIESCEAEDTKVACSLPSAFSLVELPMGSSDGRVSVMCFSVMM